MEGQDTELDKTIIEAIKDPLTHLVRNAVDHGIESPELGPPPASPPRAR
jgi:two-component system, chemotaxis family, sensor kinase CheA